MKILVLSCDKNEDLFTPFYLCMEKYWKDHPEIIYSTETIKNPYYKTICVDIPLELWTKRIRKVLDQINDDKILLIMDDCFIRQPVDKERINYVEDNLKGNIAMFNFEKSFDDGDIPSKYDRFKIKNPNGIAIPSIMCAMWQKDKLKTVLNITCKPWEIERLNIAHNFEYYINSGDYIIDYGYMFPNKFGVYQGMWCRELVEFFKKEGIDIDYSKRSFYD